jgi:hypothetical protein
MLGADIQLPPLAGLFVVHSNAPKRQNAVSSYLGSLLLELHERW